MNLEHLRESAVRAFRNTSFDPEGAGNLLINQQEIHLINFLINVPEEHKVWVAEKYISLFSNYLSAKSRCVSSFITGGSNFPVKRAKKFNEWEDSAYQRFTHWREKLIDRLNRKDKVTLDVEYMQTEEKIEKLTGKQEMMKSVNKIVKSKKLTEEEKTDELENLGLTEKTIPDLIKPDSYGRFGFHNYELTNNLAKIKHYNEKLIKLSKRVFARGEEMKEILINGVTVKENIEADRLQLFFEGIPSIEIRSDLKRNGFKWSPLNACWQTYLNSGKHKLKSLLFYTEVCN